MRLARALPTIPLRPWRPAWEWWGWAEIAPSSWPIFPGSIAGAHEGKGLGIRFLRHVERTRLLLHMVDVAEHSCRDPLEDYDVILNELQSFSPVVAAKPTLLVASRIDAVGDGDRLIRLREFCAERGLPLHEISSVTGRRLGRIEGSHLGEAGTRFRNRDDRISDSSDDRALSNLAIAYP